MDDGWTTVRYGRGPKRGRQPFWDRGYGRSNGGMDRASSFSPWRGKRVPFPNPNPKSSTPSTITITLKPETWTKHNHSAQRKSHLTLANLQKKVEKVHSFKSLDRPLMAWNVLLNTFWKRDLETDSEICKQFWRTFTCYNWWFIGTCRCLPAITCHAWVICQNDNQFVKVYAAYDITNFHCH